jgi:putative ABC transport system permease protein
MRVIRGRDLNADDLAGRRPVAVVNAMLMNRDFKGSDPIGRSITLTIPGDDSVPVRRTVEIVGVVSDAKNRGVTDPMEPEIFVPASAAPARYSQGILVRAAGPPLALAQTLKREIWAVNPAVAVSESDAIITYVRQTQFAEPQLGLFVFGSFAAIGLALVILGVSSLIAYTVARQQREIGIRLAIGASRFDVFRLTFGLGLRWLALGVAIGLVGSLAVTRVLTQQLWEVSPTDPLTIGLVVAVLATTGLIASYVPARKATRVDPLVVLRAE